MVLRGTSLMVQWLGICTSNAGGRDLILGWGTKILQAVWYRSQVLFLFLKRYYRMYENLKDPYKLCIDRGGALRGDHRCWSQQHLVQICHLQAWFKSLLL